VIVGQPAGERREITDSPVGQFRCVQVVALRPYPLGMGRGVTGARDLDLDHVESVGLDATGLVDQSASRLVYPEVLIPDDLLGLEVGNSGEGGRAGAPVVVGQAGSLGAVPDDDVGFHGVAGVGVVPPIRRVGARVDLRSGAGAHGLAPIPALSADCIPVVGVFMRSVYDGWKHARGDTWAEMSYQPEVSPQQFVADGNTGSPCSGYGPV